MAQTSSPSAETPASAAPTGAVGPLLRQTREALGKDISAIADSLRIRREHLKAIEESNYDALPGPTYAVGFVRAYAEHLGLDGHEVVRRFKAEGQSLPGGNDLSFPVPVREGGIPSSALIGIALVLAGLVYGGWYLSNSTEGSVADMIQDLPDRFAALISDTESPAADPAVEPAATDAGASTSSTPATTTEVTPKAAGDDESPLAAMPSAPVAPAPATPAPATPATPATPAPSAPVAVAPVTSAPVTSAPVAAAPAKPVPAAPVPAPAQATSTAPAAVPAAPHAEQTAAAETAAAGVVDETVPPEEEPATDPEPVAGPFQSHVLAGTDLVPAQPTPPQAGAEAVPVADGQVVIIARGDAWIEVTQNGRAITKRMLRSGDRYVVPEGAGMMLRTGNAGGTQISVNGRLIRSLGDNGQVASGVSLAPKDLQVRFGL